MIDWFYLVATQAVRVTSPKISLFSASFRSGKMSFRRKVRCQTVRSTKCSFDKVSVGKMSLRQTSISNEAVLFIRDEDRDMVVEIVAYTTLKCLAYDGQQ